MRYLLLNIIMVATALASSSMASADQVTTAPVNAVCPIMGHKVRPNGGSAIWNGQWIGFCCKGCVPKWNKLSDVEKARKLVGANRGQQHQQQSSEHNDHHYHG